jgi:predicted metal-dependent hydrolase
MNKHERIAEFARQFEGQGTDPRYAGYFALFNAQKFYEAHDVLEDLWLADKHGANGNFYKGLIQLAGAFVHLQKNRLHPSVALFKLARTNLEKYPVSHQRLNSTAVLKLIEIWMHGVESEHFKKNPLEEFPTPTICLSPARK